MSIITISVATAVYTILGGLRAVMITDMVQAVLLLTGAALLTLFGILALGDAGITSWADLKAACKANQLSMVQPISDPNAPGHLGLQLREYSWYSILFGYPVLGIWCWCTDQTIVQKILSARTEKDSRDGAIFAGFLKILPVFLMVFPGVVGYVLFKEKIGTDNDATLMVMMTELLPVGVRGLMAAGLLAALMSTIAAALLFNVVVGMIYLVVDIPLVGDYQYVAQGFGIPFMQVGWYLFLLSSLVYFTVSLLTPAPDPSRIEGLCWTRPLDALRGKLEGVLDPRIFASILLGIMIVLYAIFW